MPGMYSMLQKGVGYTARGIGMGAGLLSIAGRSWTARGMAAGMAAGGMYGAVSQDTSIIGGMMAGGTMGALGGPALSAGIQGRRAYQISKMVNPNAGAREAILSGARTARATFGGDISEFRSAARMSSRLIGNSITNSKTYGRIRGIFK